MAQKRFTNFRDPVNSFPLGEMNVGLMKPGRYNGFNKATLSSGLDYSITHDGLGSIMKTDSEGNYINFGSLLMPNGTIIHEDDSIIFTLDSNAGNANTRFDLIICEHTYVEVVGGAAATYLLVKGPNNGTMPALPDPSKQILIGYFKINANATTGSGVEYIPSPATFPGDLTVPGLYDLISVLIPNATTMVKGIVQLATDSEAAGRSMTDRVLTPSNLPAISANMVSSGLIRIATENEILDGGANDLAVTPIRMKKWGRIRNNIIVSNNLGITLSSGTTGHNGQVIVLNGDFSSAPVIEITIPTGLTPGFWCRFITRTQGAKVIAASGVTINTPVGMKSEVPVNSYIDIEQTINSGNYLITSSDLIPVNPPLNIPIGGIIDYKPPTSDLSEFDGTGLGISGSMIGFAICNGANGTPDIRGRVVVGQTPSDADFDLIGDTGGSKTHTLTKAQLPAEPIKLFTTESMNQAADLLTNFPDRNVAWGADGEYGGNGDDNYKMTGSTQPATIGNSAPLGSGQSFSKMIPYIALVKIMRIV